MLARDSIRNLSLAFALLAAACGDEDKESGDIPEPFHFSALQLPFTDSAMCKAEVLAKHADGSPVTACRCDKCLDLMQECEAVTGCPEIMACVDRARCTNEFDCYLLPGAKCADVIDLYGNSSLATTIGIGLMACSNNPANNCRQ